MNVLLPCKNIEFDTSMVDSVGNVIKKNMEICFNVKLKDNSIIEFSYDNENNAKQDNDVLNQAVQKMQLSTNLLDEPMVGKGGGTRAG